MARGGPHRACDSRCAPLADDPVSLRQQQGESRYDEERYPRPPFSTCPHVHVAATGPWPQYLSPEEGGGTRFCHIGIWECLDSGGCASLPAAARPVKEEKKQASAAAKAAAKTGQVCSSSHCAPHNMLSEEMANEFSVGSQPVFSDVPMDQALTAFGAEAVATKSVCVHSLRWEQISRLY